MPNSDMLPVHQSVVERYEHLVGKGDLAFDEQQHRVAARLDDLIDALSEKRLQRKSSALGWIFASRKSKPESVRGLYLHGGVGCGKTMLMDLFFELAPPKRKRRAHFNDFMADVHDRIGQYRKSDTDDPGKGRDPIPPVAAAIAKESWLICFDEFTVTDIADAMILSRLFAALFDQGCVLVATSNVAPRDLYRDGLNRSLFVPFIDILEKHTDVIHFEQRRDYRLRELERLPVYVTSGGDAVMDDVWTRLKSGKPETPITIAVKGRTLEVERAAGRAARFTFDDLCVKSLGARDYLAITDQFDTLVIDRVPVMQQGDRNAAKRFILLVDTLYDRKKRVFMSAEAEPTQLYRGMTGTETFEFDRTSSRLIEMQTREWAEQATSRAED